MKKAPSFLASLSTSVPMSSSHPEARVYKGNFKKSKEALCKQLFSIFNEKVFDKKLPDDMLIEWSTRMTGTAGFCYNKKSIRALGSVTRSSRIVLATKVGTFVKIVFFSANSNEQGSNCATYSFLCC